MDSQSKCGCMYQHGDTSVANGSEYLPCKDLLQVPATALAEEEGEHLGIFEKAEVSPCPTDQG